MNFTLKVDKSTCIKCGKCVRICPAHIFRQDTPKDDITLQQVETCIKCGHCVAICPTDSVLHSVFPPEKVHAIDPALLPSPEQVLLLMQSRRSNRAFSKKPVPQEIFDTIIEAAHRAPTASNKQEIEFTLVTDPKVLQQIIRLTVDVFDEKIKKATHPLIKPIIKLTAPHLLPVLSRLNALVESVAAGQDPILRGATSVLFIHAPKGNDFGRIDANLAYQNGSIMAESLGVNQFYTGFICRSIDEDKQKRINKLLGIEGDIHAGLAMGMPAFRFPNYIDKKDSKVTKI